MRNGQNKWPAIIQVARSRTRFDRKLTVVRPLFWALIYSVGMPCYVLYCGPRHEKEARWVPAVVTKVFATCSVNVRVFPYGGTLYLVTTHWATVSALRGSRGCRPWRGSIGCTSGTISRITNHRDGNLHVWHPSIFHSFWRIKGYCSTNAKVLQSSPSHWWRINSR